VETVDLRSAPLAAVSESDHARGAVEAPVVLFYGDFSCPACAVAHARLRVIPVRLVFRHFVFRSRPRALALALVAEAAALQGAFWELYDALFEDQAHSDDPHVWAHAERLGLDLARLQADRRSQAVHDRVARDVHDGMRGGIALAPTLVIDGLLHGGAPGPELLATLGMAR
jgi:protein-disulfide isomerase